MSRRHVLCALAACALAPGLAGAVALQSGAPVTFSLPGNALASDLFIDVPAGAGALRIEVDALTAGRDLDLVVRSGAAFEIGSAPDALALYDQAQYYSSSALGEETIVITPAGIWPLRAGRWHIGVFNFSGNASDVQLRATVLDEAPVVPIEVAYDVAGSECDIAPWNTERRAAMDRAAELLTEQLRPRAPVRVQACWRDLEDGVLANASAQDLFVHDHVGLGMKFLPQPYTWYSAAAAAQAAGTSLCGYAGGSCDRFDIKANFNSNTTFYYGQDSSPGGLPDFISTAMHEITHGLGFFGLIDVENGERLTDYADAYDQHVRYSPIGAPAPAPLLDLDDATRLQAVTSGSGLRFHGPNVLDGLGFALRLYAPAAPNPGSTLSHLDTTVFGTQMMAHRIPAQAPHDLGFALPVLYDVGWDPAPRDAPQALLPPGGQYYDPAFNGHGIAMYKVAGTANFYFVVFYTYDSAGLPEYYVSNGHVVDGVFVPGRNQNGDSLVRSLYDGTLAPPTVIDAAADFTGLVRIDFNDAARSPACRDGRSDRSFGGTSAVMTFTLPGSTQQQWCLQGIAENPAVANDLTNIWLNFDDVGWGASSLSFPGPAGDGLAMQVYYPDAQGRPRWAIMQTAEYQVGESYPLLQAIGYCRTCAAPAAQQFVEVGTITVGLTEVPASGAPPESRLDFTVTFNGPAGGSFVRDTTVAPGASPNGG